MRNLASNSSPLCMLWLFCFQSKRLNYFSEDLGSLLLCQGDLGVHSWRSA